MRRRARGLTLIEVLLTMVLIGVLSASVVTLMPNILHMTRRSVVDQETTVSAKAYFESLRGLWAEPAAYQAATLPDTPVGCEPPVVSGDLGGYRRVMLTCGNAAGPFTLELGDPSL